MYSLGLTILLPQDYERLVREVPPGAGPGSQEDPFVLEPITVEVARTYPAVGWLALLALAAAVATSG